MATTSASTSVRKRKRISQEQIRPWCDLPEDLVGELMAGFPSADQIRLGAACKNFYSLIPIQHDEDDNDQNKVCDKLDKRPWVVNNTVSYSSLNYLSIVHVCKLVNPLRQRQPYLVHEITAKDGFSDQDFISILASKHGWLLLSGVKETQKIYPLKTCKTSFLLLSPFTKQTIDLPNLDLHSIFQNYNRIKFEATFSSDPSSTDCVCFVMAQDTSEAKVVSISTFRQGDSDWTTLVFNEESKFVYCSVAYHEGSFYCVSLSSRLAAYDVDQRDWKIVFPSRRVIFASMFRKTSYLLVCEGKLLKIVLETSVSEADADKDQCSVLEFSFSLKAWVRRTSLGNHTVFLGYTSFVSPTIGEMSDRIYYYRFSMGDWQCRYYSLKDYKCYPDRYYCCYSNVLGVTWIEPPQLKVSQLC